MIGRAGAPGCAPGCRSSSRSLSREAVAQSAPGRVRPSRNGIGSGQSHKNRLSSPSSAPRISAAILSGWVLP